MCISISPFWEKNWLKLEIAGYDITYIKDKGKYTLFLNVEKLIPKTLIKINFTESKLDIEISSNICFNIKSY